MGTDRSRHSKYSERRTPRQKRSISVYGEREDSGKFFRCWNCGFICNIERDTLDTGEFGGSGVAYNGFTINITDRTLTGDPAGVTPVLDGGIGHFEVAPVAGSDGLPVTVVHSYSAGSGSGCPFCGTKAWK